MITRRHTARSVLIPGPRDDLCREFANTLSWRGSPTPSESLGGIDDLLTWLARAAKLPAEIVEIAGNRLRRHPNEAAALFAEAIAPREVIYRIFSALAGSEPAADKDLALLNRALAAAPRRERLAHADDGYGWAAGKLDVSVAGLLAPVLCSAAAL